MTLPRTPLDVECFPNYFLIKAFDPQTGQFFTFDQYPGKPLDIAAVRMFIALHELITFNGNHYDVPMISAALCGYDCATLKQLSDTLIKSGMRSWQFMKQFNIPEIPNLRHIDLFEVAPGVRIGLKLYMGRMHSKRIAHCPLDFNSPVAPHERPIADLYCEDDLYGTADLLAECKERLELREFIGKEYNIECMSKSDAQMGEAMIRARLPFNPKPIPVPHGSTFKYTAPNFVSFVTPQLQQILELVQRVDFVVYDTDQTHSEELDANGDKIKTGVKMPPELKKLVIPIGNSKYKIGIGGLHSQESCVNHHTIIGSHTISDHDVKAYYPSLIHKMQMYPAACGPEFIPIYKNTIDARMEAKRLKQKVRDKGLKIGLNGPFGKLGSKYSFLFAPELLIATTIGGQLSILMLIERLELLGVSILSANTDGIVIRTPCGLEKLRDDAIRFWENTTGLEMEATFYKSIYQRDVNNYIAFKYDGESKGVGIFKASGIENNKHPHNDIVADAVRDYLGKQIPIEHTVRTCNDIRKFVQIRQAKGGAVWRGQHLGNAIRWYKGLDQSSVCNYATNGNKVADSDGCVPVMELPDTMPGDVNYDYYINECYDLLREMGIVAKQEFYITTRKFEKIKVEAQPIKYIVGGTAFDFMIHLSHIDDGEFVVSHKPSGKRVVQFKPTLEYEGDIEAQARMELSAEFAKYDVAIIRSKLAADCVSS